MARNQGYFDAYWADKDGTQLVKPDGTFVGAVTAITNPDGSTSLVGAGDYRQPKSYTKKVYSVKGEEILDFGTSDFLPAGASFSGSGTYASAGRVAVQSTGTLTNNPTGWHDGTPCLEFVPSLDASEFRLYFDAATTAEGHAKLNFNDVNGIGIEYEIVAQDTSKTGISINMEFSNDATNNFPANKASLPIFNNDSSGASQNREYAGRKYTRFRLDSLATDAKCGNWPGKAYNAAVAGTGADYTKPVNFIRIIMNKIGIGNTIKFKRLLLGGYSTPCIVLVTDNATPDTLNTLIAPLVAKLGIAMGGNNAVATFTSSPAALKRFNRFYAAGWELNGNDMIDRALGTTITDATLMAEAVNGTKAFQLSQGWYEGSKVWIANNNSSSYLMIAALQAAGYVANRNGSSEGRYCFPEGGMPERYLIPAISADNATLTSFRPIIDRCIEYGATLWVYFHNVLSSAQLDTDRTNNIMNVAGAPMARSGAETIAQYQARMTALGGGDAVAVASLLWLTRRIGTGYVTAGWYEDLKPIIDYIGAKQLDGSLVTRTPSDWCRDVGFL